MEGKVSPSVANDNTDFSHRRTPPSPSRSDAIPSAGHSAPLGCPLRPSRCGIASLTTEWASDGGRSYRTWFNFVSTCRRPIAQIRWRFCDFLNYKYSKSSVWRVLQHLSPSHSRTVIFGILLSLASCPVSTLGHRLMCEPQSRHSVWNWKALPFVRVKQVESVCSTCFEVREQEHTTIVISVTFVNVWWCRDMNWKYIFVYEVMRGAVLVKHHHSQLCGVSRVQHLAVSLTPASCSKRTNIGPHTQRWYVTEFFGEKQIKKKRGERR